MKAYNQTKSILTSGQALVHHQAPRPTPLNYPTLLRQPRMEEVFIYSDATPLPARPAGGLWRGWGGLQNILSKTFE